MDEQESFLIRDFTLQNDAGAIAVQVKFLPPDDPGWHPPLSSSDLGNGGPKSKKRSLISGTVLKARQDPVNNVTASLDGLTPQHTSQWYGPFTVQSTFFMALATMIVALSDQTKDVSATIRSVETVSFRLTVTSTPAPGQPDCLTARGILDILKYAYEQMMYRLEQGVDTVTNFEGTVVWSDELAMKQQWSLRIEGPVR